MRWTIEVRNYRGFTDRNPLRIDLSVPLTALIGPNNSGKSSALKFFWELGQILHAVPDSIIAQNQGGGTFRSVLPSSFRLTSDQYSIFTELNNRPIVIDLHQHESEIPEAEFGGFLEAFKQSLGRPLHIEPVTLRVKIDRSNLSVELFLLEDGREVVVQESSFIWYQDTRGAIYARKNDHRCYYLDHSNKLTGLYHATFLPAVRSFGAQHINPQFDLQLGQQLVATWNNYKLSTNSAARKIAASVERELASVFGYEQLEIVANAGIDDFIFRIDNNQSFNLKDMGSGIAQFLTVLINVMNRGNQIVLVDEPEIGIHATLQVELMTLIAKYATGPVLFATHSIGLARSVADKVLNFSVMDGESIVTDFERSPNYLETLGELSFSAWRELGCDSVLFVEGVHDVKVMREWLRLLGKELKAVVLPLGGNEFISSDGVEAIKQVIQVHPKVAVVIDSERDGPQAELDAKRKEFSEDCQRVGIPCLVTQRRATENYFPDSAIKEVIGEHAFAIGEFDQLKKKDCGWGKRDGFRIAARMSPEAFKATDIGQFLIQSLS